MKDLAAHRNIRELVEAVENQGPAFQQRVAQRHRAEWPTIWAAIDKIIVQYHNEVTLSNEE